MQGFVVFVCTSWIFCNLLIRNVLFTLLNEIVCARKTTNLQTTTYKVLWKRLLIVIKLRNKDNHPHTNLQKAWSKINELCARCYCASFPVVAKLEETLGCVTVKPYRIWIRIPFNLIMFGDLSIIGLFLWQRRRIWWNATSGGPL